MLRRNVGNWEMSNVASSSTAFDFCSGVLAELDKYSLLFEPIDFNSVTIFCILRFESIDLDRLKFEFISSDNLRFFSAIWLLIRAKVFTLSGTSVSRQLDKSFLAKSSSSSSLNML